MHFLEGWGISLRLTYFVDFLARAIRRVVVLGAEAASSMIFFIIFLVFGAYADGFITAAGGLLKDSEIMLLPEGAKMMTIECGMRFLTDYLSGDTYFKTKYPEHNLVRSKAQFKLLQSVEAHQAEMQAFIAEVVK